MNSLDSAADISAWGGVSPEAVRFFAAEMGKRGLIRGAGSPEAKDLAEILCLTEGNCLTLAGAALLCGRPDRYVEGTYIRIGMFGSDGKLLKEDIIKEPLILQPQSAVRRLFDGYLESKVVYGNLHIDAAYDYPPEAVREAVVNACAHRDFGSGCPVEIRVLPDSLSVSNCGSLPEGWTVSDLLGDHRSRPRNIRIADAFHDAGLMQCWGKGFEKISGECRSAGIPFPSVSAEASDFTVTFGRACPEPEQVFCGDEPPLPEEDSNIENRILGIISEGKLRTGQEISDALGINRRQFTRIMSRLMDEGKITREGSRRKGKWTVCRR